MAHAYADYRDVDQKQLEKDIDAIKVTIGARTQEDFQHLLKLERWGRISTLSGFFILFVIIFLNSTDFSIAPLAFWIFGIGAAFLISVGNVARWSNIAHPILHGAYDKVPNIPLRYTKKGFAAGKRRWTDWLDWIKPEAWAFEHNIMHHYHLGELDDPDNVEKNLEWLHKAKIPMFFKYFVVYSFAAMWKIAYYAPNTLRILDNKANKRMNDPRSVSYQLSPFTKNGLELWKHYILPYGLFQFVFLPLLLLPLGGALFLLLLVLLFWLKYLLIYTHF